MLPAYLSRVSNTARSSLFALRLHPEVETGVPFGQLAEFPIDAAISSFNVSRSQHDFEIYCAMPHGIDQITISEAALNELFSPLSAKEAVSDVAAPVSVSVPGNVPGKKEEISISVPPPAVEPVAAEDAVHSPFTDGPVGSSAPAGTKSRKRSKAAAAAAATITPPEDSFGAPGIAASTSRHPPSSSSSATGEGVSIGLLAEIKKVEDNLKIKMTSLLEKQSKCSHRSDGRRSCTC